MDSSVEALRTHLDKPTHHKEHSSHGSGYFMDTNDHGKKTKYTHRKSSKKRKLEKGSNGDGRKKSHHGN